MPVNIDPNYPYSQTLVSQDVSLLPQRHLVLLPEVAKRKYFSVKLPFIDKKKRTERGGVLQVPKLTKLIDLRGRFKQNSVIF